MRISFSQNGHRWPNSDREIYSWSGKKQSLDERETRQTDCKQLWKVSTLLIFRDSFQLFDVELCFRVAKMRSTTSCQNIVKSILYPEKLDHIEGVR